MKVSQINLALLLCFSTNFVAGEQFYIVTYSIINYSNISVFCLNFSGLYQSMLHPIVFTFVRSTAKEFMLMHSFSIKKNHKVILASTKCTPSAPFLIPPEAKPPAIEPMTPPTNGTNIPATAPTAACTSRHAARCSSNSYSHLSFWTYFSVNFQFSFFLECSELELKITNMFTT